MPAEAGAVPFLSAGVQPRIDMTPYKLRLMKLFHSEYRNDYSTYTFSYAAYCLKERQEELPEIYARGFLPYTGNLELLPEVFYLARSLRIDLSQFKDTSENRRVDRKVACLEIALSVIPKAEFLSSNLAFVEFCAQYAEERFSGGEMNELRLRYLLSRPTLTDILAFSSGEKPLGYVFACLAGGMAHYWFSFFDTAYLKSHSLGKWMMWRTINWAKDAGLDYVYLGTCYTRKALYKVRDHEGIEFFDGVQWNNDRDLLASLCDRDESDRAPAADLFKSWDDERIQSVFDIV